MRSDIAQGDGMYRSTMAARRGARSGSADSQQIARILVRPADPDRVYVAALGHPYGPNAERGVFRSRDGGATWQKILGPNADQDTGAIDIAFEPGNPEVLYAALWQTRRTPWSVYPPSNGPGSGLYKSIDGGEHWTRDQRQRLSRAARTRRFRARRPATAARLRHRRRRAGRRAVPLGRRRRDWRRTSADPRIWSRGWYFGGITVDPGNADVVYSLQHDRAALRATAARPSCRCSGDNTRRRLPRSLDRSGQSARQILGVDQGALVTVNDGANVEHLAQPADRAALPRRHRRPLSLLASTARSRIPARSACRAARPIATASRCMQFREIDRRRRERQHRARSARSGRPLRRPRRPPRPAHATDAQGRSDARAAGSTTGAPGPCRWSSRGSSPAFSTSRNQRLFRTDDGGAHWTVDQPRSHARRSRRAGEPRSGRPRRCQQQTGPRRGVVYAIAPSRLADHELWVGTDDGLVWRTRDEGGALAERHSRRAHGLVEDRHDRSLALRRRDRLPRGRSAPPRRLRPVHLSHARRRRVLATDRERHRRRHAVNVVREDPVRKGLLYAGTERGVYVSFDDGEHWQSLQLEPADHFGARSRRSQTTISSSPRTAAGSGSLDDVTPLRGPRR